MSGGEYLKRGERRNVTVVFADMQGFTHLSEGMDPEEMDSLMSRVFGGFESIVERYGGAVEKYIGDALVAVFGVPDLHEDDPTRAISAAVDFLDEIGRLNSEREDTAPVAFRIGIHTGLITTGKRGEYDVVTGHAMSVASRLQSEAEPNAILVSEATRDLTGNDFQFEAGREIVVRGKEEAVTAYAVTGRKTVPTDDDSVFVGRKSITDSIFRNYLRHNPLKTDGCVLTGPAGMGKSRVAREVLERVRQLPDFHGGVLYARGQRYRTASFAVVTDLLSGYFQLSGNMDAPAISRRLTDEFRIDEKTATAFSELVTGRATEQDNQAFVLLYLMLKTVVERHGDAPYSTLLCIENLFFVDKGSLDFFTFFLRNADTKPFFLCTDRIPSSKTMAAFGELEQVELPPLDREETETLVRALAPDLPGSPIMQAILENAGGNPLFVREYVRYASENRDAQALPTTIQNIFLASIDSYRNDYRDLLKKLAVFAHSFRITDALRIQEVTDGDLQIVEDAVAFFLSEGILIREDDLYLFRYDLFKKALYSSLLNYNKKIMHRVIADLMERNGSPHPFRLLHHLIRAEEYDRATDVLLGAEGSGINMEYLRYADRLLEYWSDRNDERQMSLMFLKSAILFNNGVTERIDSLLKEIIDQAVRTRSFLSIGQAYHLLTAYNMKSYCFRKARYCGQKALESYSRVPGEVRKHQNLLELMTSAELLRNNLDEVDRLVQRMRDLEGVPESTFSSARLEVRIAENELVTGNYARATTRFVNALEAMPAANDTWYTAQMLLGMATFLSCDWERSLAACRAVLEGPSRHHSNISQVHARIGLDEYFLGDRKAAERSLQQAEFNASQIRNDFDRIDAVRTLAMGYLWKGDTDRAASLAADGLSAGLRHTATYPVMTLLMILLECAHRSGDEHAVGFYLNEAILLVDSGVLLANRDLIQFHYFRSLYGGRDPDACRNQAREALIREQSAIGEPKLIQRFLSLGSFGAIAGQIGTPIDGEQPMYIDTRSAR